MDVEFTLPREPKTASHVRPSEGTTSDSESSDTSDHSDFTTVRRQRVKSFGTKTRSIILTQTPMGLRTARITPSSKAKRLPAEATVSTNLGRSMTLPKAGGKPSQPATASQGAWIVVLRGVPKELPVDEVKEDPISTSPVQSPRPTIRRLKPPSSKSGAYVLRRQRSSPANAPYPGSAITASPGHSSRHCYSARCVKCPATTAQRNVRAIRTQTVHPPVSYANKRPHGQLSRCPRAPKEPHCREGCAAPSACARRLVHTCYAEQRPDRVTPRPQQK
ncbi:hypothetical protein EVAR_51825_1 [Eumeta japonica]|uniref:Uncharacterized protein n=1 Tax=Eumeta variegata TaxID=151549 RepID=A0A4C1ZZ40_EUMVA|nr:hypothetical protein EVAR_51825_1 [Eumeta japonica]